jgi:hypothetical protein
MLLLNLIPLIEVTFFNTHGMLRQLTDALVQKRRLRGSDTLMPEQTRFVIVYFLQRTSHVKPDRIKLVSIGTGNLLYY